MYVKNMGQLMMEKITNADLLIFNRCNEELRAQLRSRNLRMVNRRADIYLENEDGTSEEYVTPEMSPFDLVQRPAGRAGRRLRRLVCGHDGQPRPLRGRAACPSRR